MYNEHGLNNYSLTNVMNMVLTRDKGEDNTNINLPW